MRKITIKEIIVGWTKQEILDHIAKIFLDHEIIIEIQIGPEDLEYSYFEKTSKPQSQINPSKRKNP